MAGAPPPKMGTQRSARHPVRRPCPARRANRATRPRRLDRPVDPCPARCGVAGSGWGSAGSRSAARPATGSLLTEGVAGSVQACAPDRRRMGLPLAVAIARPNPPAATTRTRALATPRLTTPAPSKRSCRLTQPDAQILAAAQVATRRGQAPAALSHARACSQSHTSWERHQRDRREQGRVEHHGEGQPEHADEIAAHSGGSRRAGRPARIIWRRSSQSRLHRQTATDD